MVHSQPLLTPPVSALEWQAFLLSWKVFFICFLGLHPISLFLLLPPCLFLLSLICWFHLISPISGIKLVFFLIHTHVLGDSFSIDLGTNVWRRQWHPTPVLLPGKSHGWRSLVGCSPWNHEESDTTERLHFHALEKEMATHSSVLAWRIPGTAEPGGLPSMGLHRVGHDWSDLAAAAAAADTNVISKIMHQSPRMSSFKFLEPVTKLPYLAKMEVRLQIELRLPISCP